MPTMIYFADAKRVEVAEDPHQVCGRLNENAGLPVRFDAHYGSKTNVVYVNPGQITYFEETPAFEGRVGPFTGSHRTRRHRAGQNRRRLRFLDEGG